jgi:hypothetical protein
MQKLVQYAAASATVWGLTASVASAGTVAPAPLLGAGLPGLALMGVAGAGYLVVRAYRKSKD